MQPVQLLKTLANTLNNHESVKEMLRDLRESDKSKKKLSQVEFLILEEGEKRTRKPLIEIQFDIQFDIRFDIPFS